MSTENKPLSHYESANDSSNNTENYGTNVLSSSLEKNHDIVVNICNDSIPKNKVSKQTQEESANDPSNNAENDFTNPLPSSLEKNYDIVVNTCMFQSQRTKSRYNLTRNL